MDRMEDPDARRRKLAALLRARAAVFTDRPLSPGQERLWRLVRLEPDAPLYNVAVAYRLDGALDRDAMERAVRQIEARHDVLRTVFLVVEGTPLQRIAPTGTHGSVFAYHDLGPSADETSLDAFVAREASRRIDLTHGPCWRLAVVRLGPARHALVLTMHHIITDGWSFELFLKELSAFYAGGTADDPAPVPVQYADIAQRQRADLDSGEMERQRNHWRRVFEHGPPALRLPADRTATTAAREAASMPFELDGETTAKVLAVARDEAASLFIVTLAVFAAVLGAGSGQRDILACTPMAGRHRARTRDTIGYFNNILPMWIDLSGTPSLIEVVRRTRSMALAAFEHQDVPFDWIAALPGLRHVPLSRLLFSLDMPWPPVLALDGLDCSPLPVETGTADFDLSVSLWLEGTRLRGTLRYKRALFDASTVEGLATRYAEALRHLVHAPSTMLGTPAVEGADARSTPAATLVSPAELVLPRTPVELRLAQEWEAVFGRYPVGVTEDLEALGASSLTVADLAERIEAAFRTPVPVTNLFRAGTIEGMAGLLQSADDRLLRSPLAPIKASGSRPPLFLCEGVGIYFPLARRLDAEQPVWGLVTELVGDYPNVEALAAHYVEAVRGVAPAGPYRLGGISFGGLVAFEMAQQLVAAGERVSLLALFDTPGPGAYRRKSVLGRAIGHARNTARYGVPYVVAKLGRRRTVPVAGGSDDSDIRRLVGDQRRVRAVFERAAARYVARPYPGRITLFSLANRDAMADSLFDPALGHIDPLLGWGSVALGGVEHRTFSGEHISMLQEPHVEAIAAFLEADLAMADAEPVNAI